jgi:pimeloyl-ACP methyl ester carboxylesterase
MLSRFLCTPVLRHVVSAFLGGYVKSLLPKLIQLVVIVTVACGLLYVTACRKTPTPTSSVEATAEKPRAQYLRNDKKDRVIVFVHGIFGSPLDTWKCAHGDFYWPKALLSDPAFNDSDVYIAAYDSPYMGDHMTIDEIVSNLANRFQSDGVFNHREVVFVAHSLGGLITQRFLITHRELAKQVPFIAFYATPETGAQVAQLGHVLSADPLLKEMFPGPQNDYLLNLRTEELQGVPGRKPHEGRADRPSACSSRLCDEQPQGLPGTGRDP